MFKKSLDLERVSEAVERFKLLRDGDKVLVGFSGGADSTYCLLALKHLGYDISALHINHGIRKNALRDEIWCVEFCNSINVDIFVERIKVEGKGIEEKARKKRYELFKIYSKKYGFNKVALAHNLTDAFETFLFNGIRGTGILGLIIPPKVGIFVRPLILMCREDIRNALRNAGYSWIEDESNLDPTFSRNRIRMFVEPEMKKIFINWCDRFRNTYINLYEEREELLGSVENYSSENFLKAGNMGLLRIKNEILSLRVLSRIMDVEIKPLRRIMSLRDGKTFIVRDKKLVKFKDFIFIIPNRALRLEDLNLKMADNGRYKGKISTPGIPIARFRKPGDTIGKLKVKHIFDKVKLPGFLRDIYPLVEVQGRIVWIPFIYEEGGEYHVGFDRLNPNEPDFFDILKMILPQSFLG